MKTKFISTILILVAIATGSTAQTSFTTQTPSSYFIEEAPAELVPVAETYFGAEMDYSSMGGKITTIVPNSPAETFSFRTGDLISAINGEKITSEEGFRNAISSKKPGDVVTVTYTRKKGEKQRKVKLDQITVYKKK